jgi:hypothetical protein
VRAFAFKTGALLTTEFISAGSTACLLDGSGEAARLAERFRMLAAGFFALTRQALQRLRTGRRHDPISLPANRGKPVRLRVSAGMRQLPFTDTS